MITRDIDEKLKEVICNCKDDIDKSTINDSTHLFIDLGYNSINLIQLIVQLEDAFSIEIDDDDLDVENLSYFKKLRELTLRLVGSSL